MGQTHVLSRFVVVLSFLVAFSSSAETVVPVEKRDALAALRKIQLAAQKLNYSGTFVYQQGAQMRTSRVTHLAEGRNEIEKLEILDGKPREYVRNNDEVICYVPDVKILQVEKRAERDVFPAMFAANPADLVEIYDVRREEGGRVAGHDCDAVTLEPKDNLRYGYKLWAEKSTGLLLRAQTLNDKHETVEQISFTQITIGNIDRSRARTSFPNTSGWHVENSATTPVSLPGWSVKYLPPGFKKIREVKRQVVDTVVGSANQSARREVSQLVFSDGLAAISVFIEPGSQSRTEGSLQQGATNVIGRRYGDFWLTIVGEVPAVALRQVANSIEFKSK